MKIKIKFCQNCGQKLDQKQVSGLERPYCSSCRQIVYVDPKLVAVVLVQLDCKLVMIRRGIQPALGHWSFPSGYVDSGEAVEDAAVREVSEETGLNIQLSHLIGLYSTKGSEIVLVAFAAKCLNGSLRAGEEVSEIALYALDSLPPLPFPHDYKILADWQNLSNRQPMNNLPLSD